MLCIFLTEQSLVSSYLPIYTKTIINDTYATLSLRMVELIALILENCRFREDGKAMSETFRDEKLQTNFSG